MGFVTAYDNPRVERTAPESCGASPETWCLDTCMEDQSYWIPVQDLYMQADAEREADAFDIAEAVANMQQYVKMRKQIQAALAKCRTPHEIYAVVAEIPADFFEIEDNLMQSRIWFDGTALNKSFYTIESKCEALLAGYRREQRSHTQSIKVFSKERPIKPVLAKKEGRILRAQTAEQLQALISLGFTIYAQEVTVA